MDTHRDDAQHHDDVVVGRAEPMAHRALRGAVAGVVTSIVVTTPLGAALGAISAASSNFLQLAVMTATYRISPVLPAQVATNTTGPLTINLNAGNNWGQIFFVQNIGDLDVATFRLSHTGPYGNGSNRVDLAYCQGGSAGGAFTSIGVCAGGGTLTTAIQGKGSIDLAISIPTGTARAFQATTRNRSSGQDTTDTISVEVSAAGVIRRGTTTS